MGQHSDPLVGAFSDLHHALLTQRPPLGDTHPRAVPAVEVVREARGARDVAVAEGEAAENRRQLLLQVRPDLKPATTPRYGPFTVCFSFSHKHKLIPQFGH